MNYSEATQSTITREQAVREIEDHCVSVEEFYSECGKKDTYLGKIVLDWLGY